MKKAFSLSFLSFLLLLNTISFSQWVYTNGPYGGTIQALASFGGYTFAGTQGSGIFISTNSGANWTQASGISATNIYCLAVSGNNIFAGAYGGVFLSTNNG